VLYRYSPLVLIAAVVLIAGCKEEEQIRSYRVDKVAPASDEPSGGGETQRMLAAMMLPAWFFKLTGPVAAVGEVEQEVRALVESVTFAGGKPGWTAPDDWNRKPASGFRFATLEIPQGDEPPLEISVTSLPQVGQDTESYVLENVNRWRGQLGQPPLTPTTLPVETESFEVDGVPTTWVDITGTSGGRGMGGPFMAGGSPPAGEEPLPEGHPPIAPGDEAPAAQPVGPQPVGPQPVAPGVDPAAGPFETPATWTRKPGNAFRKYAFDVKADVGTGEVTVIQLGAQAGSTLANVNRWRGQIGLPPLAEDQLDTVMEDTKIGNDSGQLVELVGTEQGILGAIVEKPGATWFVKLTGDAALIKAERENFESFLESLQLE